MVASVEAAGHDGSKEQVIIGACIVCCVNKGREMVKANWLFTVDRISSDLLWTPNCGLYKRTGSAVIEIGVEIMEEVSSTSEIFRTRINRQRDIVTIFPTLFLSYVIVYLHFFGHLFFILVLLIYDYSSTVCLLRRLFMHSLTVQYIRTEWTLLFCS